MARWIALFRGVNVGGKNILPMAELRSDLESLNFQNVHTYIQSGNVVFDAKSRSASGVTRKITKLVKEQYGFQPRVFVLNCDNLVAAIDANPYPDAIAKPKSLHFFFLAKPAVNPDIEALEAARSSSEHYTLTDHVFYLRSPDGIGRSKLAANAEKYLGVATTARNYRTVDKLRSLATADGQ